MINYKVVFEKEFAKQGDFPECYAFSIHKAGSTLMHKMIAEVCRSSNIPGFSIPDTLFKMGVFEQDWGDDENLVDLITPGRIYYGFRNLPLFLLNESLHLKDHKSVLLVRDPRDALVSQYYSFGGKNISHRMPDKNKDAFLEKAKMTSHLDIDQYVLHVARGYKKKLVAYKDNLNFDNVLLFKYEDIYFDKRKFLGDIFTHFGISVEPTLLDKVAARNDVRPNEEDPTKHIRKGTPGDHVNKLLPETIEKLNDSFSEICAWFGYDLDNKKVFRFAHEQLDPEILTEIKAAKWHHKIELSKGFYSESTTNCANKLNRAGIPKELNGAVCIDIGTRDGGLAFEMEKRGAGRIIANDIHEKTFFNFELAHRCIGSKVEYLKSDLYMLPFFNLPRFDIVNFLGVIYHVSDPYLSLMAMRELCKENGTIIVESAVLDGGAYSLEHRLREEDPSGIREEIKKYPNIVQYLPRGHVNTWVPSAEALKTLCEDAGLDIIHALKWGDRTIYSTKMIKQPRFKSFYQCEPVKNLLGSVGPNFT